MKRTKRGLEWRELEPQSLNCQRTGHVSVQTGRFSSHNGSFGEVLEFEWSHLPYCNTWAGLRRFLSCNTTPQELDSFATFSKIFWDDFFTRFEFPPV
jgi:hypothetical protein